MLESIKAYKSLGRDIVYVERGGSGQEGWVYNGRSQVNIFIQLERLIFLGGRQP